mgnify:CR=1 FL=1
MALVDTYETVADAEAAGRLTFSLNGEIVATVHRGGVLVVRRPIPRTAMQAFVQWLRDVYT